VLGLVRPSPWSKDGSAQSAAQAMQAALQRSLERLDEAPEANTTKSVEVIQHVAAAVFSILRQPGVPYGQQFSASAMQWRRLFLEARVDDVLLHLVLALAAPTGRSSRQPPSWPAMPTLPPAVDPRALARLSGQCISAMWQALRALYGPLPGRDRFRGAWAGSEFQGHVRARSGYCAAAACAVLLQRGHPGAAAWSLTALMHPSKERAPLEASEVPAGRTDLDSQSASRKRESGAETVGKTAAGIGSGNGRHVAVDHMRDAGVQLQVAHTLYDILVADDDGTVEHCVAGKPSDTSESGEEVCAVVGRAVTIIGEESLEALVAAGPRCTAADLMAVAAFARIPRWRQKLRAQGAGAAARAVVRREARDARGTSITRGSESSNALLQAALSAFVELLEGFASGPQSVREDDMEDDMEELLCHLAGGRWSGNKAAAGGGASERAHAPAHGMDDEEEVRAAGTVSEAVQCWALLALRKACGICGVRGVVGEAMKRVLFNGELSDVQFILHRTVNGEDELASPTVVPAHRAVLAVRCPTLLAAPSSGRAEPEEAQDAKATIHLGARVDPDAFRRLLEYAYTGSTSVLGSADPGLMQLATRCKFHCLAALLAAECPLEEMYVEGMDLAEGLRSPVKYVDAALVPGLPQELQEAASAERPITDPGWTGESGVVGVDITWKVPVHRVVLACRSEYFRARFASQFGDSMSQMLNLPELSPEAAALFSHWIYTDNLGVCEQFASRSEGPSIPPPPSLSPDTSWAWGQWRQGSNRAGSTSPDTNTNLGHLRHMAASGRYAATSAALVRLHCAAELLMLPDLQRECVLGVRELLRCCWNNTEVGLATLMAALDSCQGQKMSFVKWRTYEIGYSSWQGFAEEAVEHLAHHYQEMRGDDRFERLPENLQAAIREAYVEVRREQ
ncbi:hypothetical protein CYMTET_54844, partial [Cymbomonas tetramitiformis]